MSIQVEPGDALQERRGLAGGGSGALGGDQGRAGSDGPYDYVVLILLTFIIL